jgi:hypothetical protein
VNVPTVEVPAPLLSAVEAVEEREQELRAAEQAAAAAREGLKVGHRQDIEEVAAAREAGKPDPKPHHEQEALDVLATAEHEAEIAQARLSKIRAEYERVAEEQRPIWREQVEAEWRRLDTKQRRRARELDAAFGRMQELQTCWRYLHTLDTNPADAERTLRKAQAPALAVQVDLSALLEAIEDASADVVIERVRRADAERLAASEASAAGMEKAVEQARLEREGEIERIRRRRDAVYGPNG